jgi:hypothetical protein
MARGPLAAAMVGKTIGKAIDENQVPVYVARFGQKKEEIFVTAPELKRLVGNRFDELPPAAMGLYSYCQRLKQGLCQLMCGARKFSLAHISRDDLGALTLEASKVSGIPYIMDVDKDKVDKILEG